MHKTTIPILGPASRAYGFLLGELDTIVRLTWAPLLFGAWLWYAFGEQILTAAIASLADQSRPFEGAAALFLVSIASYATWLMALVALLGVMVLGDRKPGLFVYFWPGRAELQPGERADLLVLPANRPLGLARRVDVRLVMIGGSVRYADAAAGHGLAGADGVVPIRVDGAPKVLDAALAMRWAQALAREPGVEWPSRERGAA